MEWETQSVFTLAAVVAAVGYVVLVARRALYKQETTVCGGCAECPNATEGLTHATPQGVELISIEAIRTPEQSRQAG